MGDAATYCKALQLVERQEAEWPRAQVWATNMDACLVVLQERTGKTYLALVTKVQGARCANSPDLRHDLACAEPQVLEYILPEADVTQEDVATRVGVPQLRLTSPLMAPGTALIERLRFALAGGAPALGF